MRPTTSYAPCGSMSRDRFDSLTSSARSTTNAVMSSPVFPRMQSVRQKFPKSAALDVEREVQAQLEKTIRAVEGAKVAVAVGSRGISNLSRIVKSTIEHLKAK